MCVMCVGVSNNTKERKKVDMSEYVHGKIRMREEHHSQNCIGTLKQLGMALRIRERDNQSPGEQ